jgi:choice-of-anchor B domain-containing protein
MSDNRSKHPAYKTFIFALATMACFTAQTAAQTIKGMSTLGTYIRPGTKSASAGIWGWTSPSGKEFALLTSRDPGGLSFVDISNPALPKEIGFIPSGKSIWHEVHSYKNIAYKVSQENSDGLQIIDMSPLDQGKAPVLLKTALEWFTVAHTIYVDTTVSPARLFIAYGRTEGIKIFTLENPASPKLIHTIPGGGESHDMFARGNRLYRSNQRASTLTIFDITTLTAPKEVYTLDFDAVAKTVGEPPRGIAHNAWLSEDGRFLFTTEETIGCTVKAFDITNVSRTNPPKLVGRWIASNKVIAHNVYIKGNAMFVAHYTEGIRIVDVTDPANMKELAYHKPSSSTAEFGGTWGVYPWFKSGNVIHGDDVLGLFIEKITVPLPVPTPIVQTATQSELRITALDGGRVGFNLPREGSYRMNLYSPMGHEMAVIAGQGKSGMQTLNINQGKLSTGRYMVRVAQDGNMASTPLVLGNQVSAGH